MILQGIVFFGRGFYGWSNVFYLSAVDYNDGRTKLNAIIDSLVTLMTTNVTVQFARLSNVEVKGDSLLFAPTATAGTLTPDAAGDEDVNICARCLFTTADHIHRANCYIHDIRPSDLEIINGQTRLKATSPYRNAAGNAFIADVVANAVNWQKRTLPPVTAAWDSGAFGTATSVRRAGRPFGLPRGRRRVA